MPTKREVLAGGQNVVASELSVAGGADFGPGGLFPGEVVGDLFDLGSVSLLQMEGWCLPPQLRKAPLLGLTLSKNVPFP